MLFRSRGGINISIYSFNHTANDDNQKYGYVNKANGRTEFWIEQNAYNYKSKVEIVNADNCDIKFFETKYEKPIGLVYVDKGIVATEKSVLSVYNQDNQQIIAKDPNGKKIVFNSIKKEIGNIATIQTDGSLKFKRNCTIAISYNLFVDCASGRKTLPRD